jgi:hypothetical protein
MTDKVVFIAVTPKGKFKPMLGKLIPSEDHDRPTLRVIGGGSEFETIEPALQFLKDRPIKGAHRMLTLVRMDSSCPVWH